jgi:lipopolysaccharide export LptBFGC system permease protein LptF
MLGLGFFLASKGFGYVVLVYGISPFLGVALPTIIFSIAAMLLLRRVA